MDDINRLSRRNLIVMIVTITIRMTCSFGIDMHLPSLPSIVQNFHSTVGMLVPCLYSRAPLDLVILWLGVNDFKIEFNRTASETANGLDGLIRMIQTSSCRPDMLHSPDILLIGYAKIVNEIWVDAS